MSQPFHYSVMPNFPPPKINNNRPRLYPNKADFISGNPRGLQELAGSIYYYVSSRSSTTVESLVREVTRIIKDDRQPGGYTPDPHGGWIGATADTFRRTFISDAAMMNGLNQVMCSIAKTVDDLASGLSALEYRLESTLESKLSRVPGFNVNWLTTKGSGTHPHFEFTALARPIVQKNSGASLNAQILNVCELIAKPIFAEADRLRHTAASQLAAAGKILEEAFSYYASYSAGPGSPSTMDPSVLLTSGQARADTPAIKRLQGEYSELAKKLNASSLDGNAVKSTLSGLGVTAANSGKILGDIQGLREASGAVGTGGKFLSLVGDAVPVLMAIGMAAA